MIQSISDYLTYIFIVVKSSSKFDSSELMMPSEFMQWEVFGLALRSSGHMPSYIS
jgi:hypothetical protein